MKPRPSHSSPFAKNSRSALSPLLHCLKSPQRGLQIWCAHLDSASSLDIAELTGLLNSTERARATRFRFEQDRQRYLTARGLLRRLLSNAIDRPAQAIAFEYGAKGKPAIATTQGNGPTMRFNLSHSAGWAMFALAWDRNVGIDLECVADLTRNAEELLVLAEGIFSARELATWQALPDDVARCRAFFRAWTRKEACIKAVGQGLDGLPAIEVALNAAALGPALTTSLSPMENEAPRPCTLHDLPAPPGFAAAVAVE